MNCPKCGSKSTVVESRLVDGETVRIRKCNCCGNRYYTIEVNDTDKALSLFRKTRREAAKKQWERKKIRGLNF